MDPKLIEEEIGGLGRMPMAERRMACKRLRKNVQGADMPDEWKQRMSDRLDEIENDYDREMVREYQVAEFKGTYPEVPFAANVDATELVKGDDDPTFVILPVAEVGATSGNGLYYDEALVKQIEDQLASKTGIMGHIKDDERDTAFPTPDAIWVGSKREGNTLWAKAYILPGQAAKFIRKLKAAGGRIATSIYGRGKSEALANGKRRLVNFVLESLDFAPPERAALKLGGQFAVTAELEQDTTTEEQPVDKDKIIAELTADDAAKLPKAVIAVITEQVRTQLKAEVKAEVEAAQAQMAAAKEKDEQIAELTHERDQAQAQVTKLTESVAEYQRRDYEATLTTKVAEAIQWEHKGEKADKQVAALRKQLRRMVDSAMGDSMDLKKAERVIAEQMETEDFQVILEAARDAAAGPAVAQGGKGKQGDWREEKASKAGDLKKEWGV